MKFPYLLTLAFIIYFNSLSAQETTWFDSNWKKTTKEKASYYRPVPKKIKNGFWIVDYYMDGNILKEGFGINFTKNKEGFEGLVVAYHPNGKPSSKANYRKGKLHGVRRTYYDTGELKEQVRYTHGKENGVWKTFYKTGKIKTKGKYRDGEKVGVWKTFYKNVY